MVLTTMCLHAHIRIRKCVQGDHQIHGFPTSGTPQLLTTPASFASLCASLLHAEDRRIDPTFLYRDTSTAAEKPSDITTATCHYKSLFGKGDSDTSVVVGVAGSGEVLIDPNGACATVGSPRRTRCTSSSTGAAPEYGDEDVPLKTEDYLYVPSTISHSLTDQSAVPLLVVIMGFKTKGFEKPEPPARPLKANIEDVPTALVNGHPESTRYRLLMGDADSKRGRVPAGRVLTSLFLMEIAPGGTSFPHHHEREGEYTWF